MAILRSWGASARASRRTRASLLRRNAAPSKLLTMAEAFPGAHPAIRTAQGSCDDAHVRGAALRRAFTAFAAFTDLIPAEGPLAEWIAHARNWV